MVYTGRVAQGAVPMRWPNIYLHTQGEEAMSGRCDSPPVQRKKGVVQTVWEFFMLTLMTVIIIVRLPEHNQEKQSQEKGSSV